MVLPVRGRVAGQQADALAQLCAYALAVYAGVRRGGWRRASETCDVVVVVVVVVVVAVVAVVVVVVVVGRFWVASIKGTSLCEECSMLNVKARK